MVPRSLHQECSQFPVPGDVVQKQTILISCHCHLFDDGTGIQTEPAGRQDAPQGAPGQLPGPRPPWPHPVGLPLSAQAPALLGKLAALPGVAELGGALGLERGQLVILALRGREEALAISDEHAARPTSLWPFGTESRSKESTHICWYLRKILTLNSRGGHENHQKSFLDHDGLCCKSFTLDCYFVRAW